MGKCLNCALLIVYACDLLILVPQVVYCLHSQIIIYMYVNYCCVGYLSARVYQSLYLPQVCPIPKIYLLRGWRQDIYVPALGLKYRYPNAPSGKLRDPRAHSLAIYALVEQQRGCAEYGGDHTED
jgi:hypothetical protein